MTLNTTGRPEIGRRHSYATRAAFLVAGLSIATWAPLAPLTKLRLDINEANFGLLMLCIGLGPMISIPLTGVVISRVGCRAVIVASTIILAATMPMLAVMSDIWVAAALLTIFGACIGSIDAAMNTQAVMVEKTIAKPMMSGFHGLYSVGGIVGAGGVAYLLGLGMSPLAAMLIASGMLIALIVFGYGGLLPYGAAAGTGKISIPTVPVLLIGAGCFMMFMSDSSILGWSGLLLIDSHQIDPEQAGIAYTIFALAMAGGRLSGDFVIARLGLSRVMLLGCCLSFIGYVVTVMSTSLVMSCTGFFMIGIGAANIIPCLYTIVALQKRMPMGEAVSAITAMGYAGNLVGPAVIGFIASQWSLSYGFAMLSVFFIVVTLLRPRQHALA